MPMFNINKDRDPFLSLSLKDQCGNLGINLEILPLSKRDSDWIYLDQSFKKPEPAAYSHFKSQGFIGNYCEGKAPLMLMKCACLDFLANFFERDEACLRYFESQCSILISKSRRIIEAIRCANEKTIRKNFTKIRKNHSYLTLYPEMTVDGLLSIWQSIGPIGWAKVAEAFIRDPYTYRAGWPDLSIASGKVLRLIEVKTTDKIHTNQKVTFVELLIPLGLNVSVLKIVKK